MNLNWSQSRGSMTTDDGRLIAVGFAGNHDGRNNPDMQSVHDVGPLPQGVYRVGAWGPHAELGQLSAPLTQIAGETYGRSGFYIHGPGGADPSQCSKGCVVIEHSQRLVVASLAPVTVTVTA